VSINKLLKGRFVRAFRVNFNKCYHICFGLSCIVPFCLSHCFVLFSFPPEHISPVFVMPKRQPRYSIFSPPSLSMSELVKTTLDHDSTDLLIDKWLEHHNNGHDAYHEWFKDVRERKHVHCGRQIIAWNKGVFAPENVFCRTVDTGRLIPLDRTWTTHVYHHHSMQERRRSMMPVVLTMVSYLLCRLCR